MLGALQRQRVLWQLQGQLEGLLKPQLGQWQGQYQGSLRGPTGLLGLSEELPRGLWPAPEG